MTCDTVQKSFGGNVIFLGFRLNSIFLEVIWELRKEKDAKSRIIWKTNWNIDGIKTILFLKWGGFAENPIENEFRVLFQ